MEIIQVARRRETGNALKPERQKIGICDLKNPQVVDNKDI
jgi:hypothetical protein